MSSLNNAFASTQSISTREFSAQALGRCTLSATVHTCGKDLVVVVCGGSLHHVGACALAQPDPQNAGHATVSVLCASGHRDDEIARHMAKQIAAKLSCNVCVCAGIHIDDATPAELRAIIETSEQLSCEVVEYLLNASSFISSPVF